MDDLDERVLTLDLGATRQLSLALFRHSDSAGLITLLDLLATSAVERWLAAERSGGRDAASVWEQCVAPVIEKLGWTGIDAVRFRAPVILKETVDRLAWIINLRTLANQRIPVDDRIRAVNEAVYWLTVIGGYSVFRQRWEDLHTLLSVRTFRSHERIQERLWSKRNFPRLYESDVNRRVTSTPEVLALFMGDRENAGVNLCQFHFLAGFLFWPDAWQWYPWIMNVKHDIWSP